MFKIMLILVMYIVKKCCYLLLFAVCMCCMQMWELVSIVYIIERLKLIGTSYILSNLIGQKYTWRNRLLCFGFLQMRSSEQFSKICWPQIIQKDNLEPGVITPSFALFLYANHAFHQVYMLTRKPANWHLSKIQDEHSSLQIIFGKRLSFIPFLVLIPVTYDSFQYDTSIVLFIEYDRTWKNISTKL